MATLRRGQQTIVVPDVVAESYRAEGWSESGVIPEKPRRSKRTEKAVKDGTAIRSNVDKGKTTSRRRSVQPRQ